MNRLFTSTISAFKRVQFRNFASRAACAGGLALTAISSPTMGADGATNATTAQEFDDGRYGQVHQAPRNWKLMVGVGAIYAPEYEGSDKFDVNPLPIISAKFGDRVSVDITGVTIDVFQHDGFKLGLKGGYEIGRKEEDSRYLRGFGDVDPGGIVGGLVSYEQGPFQVYANLEKTIGGSNGLTGTLGGRAFYEYDRFVFSADVSATWADNNHMQTYFGVSSVQSAGSGRSEYEANAGFKRVDVKATATYVLNENWAITGATGLGLLMGDARNSPIVMDDVQPFSMVGVAYQF
mgnify:CR=1 FL=1